MPQAASEAPRALQPSYPVSPVIRLNNASAFRTV